MKIGLIDVDSHNFPNLFLMKISTYYKSIGADVRWYDNFSGRFDIVFVSKVFSFTPDYAYYINSDKIYKGGSGYAISIKNGKEVFDKTKDISGCQFNIDNITPDYSLYPKLTKDTAYGFLTRGCPRGCEFCIVKHKEGTLVHKVAELEDFWSGQKNIILCDPNILAYKDCLSEFDKLAITGCKIDFNQGFDIRLMTEDKAKVINRCKIKDIHFAWDKFEDKDIILPKLELFSRYSSKPHGDFGTVYTIVNFDTTLEQDLERIYTLREMNYRPYIMIYNKQHCSRVYKDLQRWVNNIIIFKSCKKFEDYIG